MADETIRRAAKMPGVSAARIRADLIRPKDPGIRVRPDLPTRPLPPRPLPPQPSVPPVTGPSPPVVSAPPPVVPAAPAENPFASLPFPSPGDRIKADDFKKLSQSLMVMRDAWQLSGSLLGRMFGEAKQALTSQQYLIQRVMSVFGNEIADLGDPSLDGRRVIQVVPLELGGNSVAVVVTEAVETRRTVPNLLNLTYADASERLQGVLGDVTFPSSSMTTSQLVGLSLDQAKSITGR